jgi:hypothetical protein
VRRLRRLLPLAILLGCSSLDEGEAGVVSLEITAPSAPKRASLWEDFVDILYAPRSVFERRREGKFGVALLVYVAIATAVAAFTIPMMMPIFDRQLDKRVEVMREQGASEQQIASARGMIQKMQGPVAGAIGGAVSSAGAVLLVSADLEEIFALADRIVVMSEGRLVFETPTEGADLRDIGRHMAGHH